MKKLLILLLLTLPIFIFAILNISATIIGWFMPLKAEKIELSLDNKNFTDALSLDNAKIGNTYSIIVKISPIKALNKDVTTTTTDKDIVSISNKKNSYEYIVKALSYGTTSITFKITQTNLWAKLYINVYNKNLDTNSLQAIILDYNNIDNSNLVFGIKNDISIKFKYYPTSIDITKIKNDSSLEFSNIIDKIEKTSDGFGKLYINFSKLNQNIDKYELYIRRKIPSNALSKIDMQYTMTLDNNGYNIDSNTSHTQLQKYLERNLSVYMQSNIEINNVLTISNSAKLNGNNFTLKHKNLDKTYAVILTDNANLLNIDIEGKLVVDKDQRYPDPKNSNILIKTSNKTTDAIIVKDTNIYYGRYNIVINSNAITKNNQITPSNVKILNSTFNGSLISSINAYGGIEIGYKVKSLDLDLQDLKFKYAANAILIQNQINQKGFINVNLHKKTNKNLKSTIDTFDNWRNLDEANSLFAGFSKSDSLSKIISQYDNSFKKINKYYYASSAIIFRGGSTNESTITILDNEFLKYFNYIEIFPNKMESLIPQIGGTYKFRVYMLNNKYYKEEIK